MGVSPMSTTGVPPVGGGRKRMGGTPMRLTGKMPVLRQKRFSYTFSDAIGDVITSEL